MDRENQARAHSALLERVAAADHRQLDDVGGGPLDHGVDRQPLAQRAQLVVARAQLGDLAAPAPERLHEPFLLGALDRPLDESRHAGKAIQVGVDEVLCLLARDVEPVGQAVIGEAVDDPVVDHLGLGAHRCVQLPGRHAEDLGGRRRVHVLAALEDLAQDRLVGDVREHAQLDLRVVHRDQQLAGRRLEAAADLAPQRRAYGHVLHVGIRARQAAGLRDGLQEGGVDPRLGVDELGQHVEIGLDQRRELAPALDLGHDLVL